MKFHRRNLSWELGPKQHLPAEVIAAEPRLADLENNAVFRLMSAKGQWNKSILWVCLIYAAFFSYIIVWDHMVKGEPLGDQIFIMQMMLICPLTMYFSRRGKKEELPRTMSQIFGIDRSLLDDLCMAGYPPKDFLHGVWGYQNNRVPPIEYFAFYIITLLIVMLLAPYIIRDPDPWSLKFFITAIYASWMIGTIAAYRKYLRFASVWSLANYAYRGSDESWSSPAISSGRLTLNMIGINFVFVMIGVVIHLVYSEFFPLIQEYEFHWLIAIPFTLVMIVSILLVFRHFRSELESAKEEYYQRALANTEMLFYQIQREMWDDTKAEPKRTGWLGF